MMLKNWKPWLLSVAVLLLLVAAGYVSVDSITSRTDLEKKLAEVQETLGMLQPTEEADAGRPADAGLDAGDPNAANPTPNPTEEVEEEEDAAGSPSATPTPTPTLGVTLTYPGDEDTLVLSDPYPEVQVALANSLDKDVEVIARLVITGEKGVEAALGRVAAAEKEVKLPAKGEANVTFGFEPGALPAAGTYQGWLTLTAQGGAVPGTPLSRPITVAVVRPALSLAGRVVDASEPMTITLSGVRPWPWKSEVQWASHTLRLWEKELLPAQYTIVPSELVDEAGGHAGLLVSKATAQKEAGVDPYAVPLDIQGVTYPGEYKGTLAVYADGGRVRRVVDVVARARDGLVWPALLIFFGALLLGWLMRVSLGDSLKSVPVLRHRIELARKRLRRARRWSKEGAKCDRVDERLTLAAVALDVHDVARAVEYLQPAERLLGEIEAPRVDKDEREEVKEAAWAGTPLAADPRTKGSRI